jgi:signal peptidase I
MARLCAKDMKFYKGLFDALEALNMARDNFVLKTLLEKGVVTFKPHGNSMTPKIDSGDQVIVKKVSAKALRVGDAVYAKVKGSYYLHLLSAIDESQGRYQISNNHGHVNGWVNADNIFGVCVEVKDAVVLSDEAIEKRLLPNVQ